MDLENDLVEAGIQPGRALTPAGTVAAADGVDWDGMDAEFDREASEADQLAAVLASLGDDGPRGKITLRRWDQKEKVWTWLAQFDIPEFETAGGVAHIAERFGGGKYECIVYDSKSRMKKRVKIAVDPSVLPTKSVAVPGNSAAPDAVLVKLVETMQQGFNQLGQLIAQSAQQKGPSRREIIDEMLMMRQLFGGESKPEGAKFSELREMIDFVKELQPREGDAGLGETVLKFAEKFGPQIGMVLENVAKNAPQLPVQAQPQPQPQPRPLQQLQPIQQPANNEGNAEMFQNAMIKHYLGILIENAARGDDPHTAAIWILDNVPPSVVDKWAPNPDLVAELAKIHPGVAAHAAWFDMVREKILEEAFDPEETPDADPAPPPVLR
jgi:hypothetical protein